MMITANDGFIEQSERYSTDNAGRSLKKYILLKKWELAYNHGASKIRPFGSCFALTRAANIRIPFVYHCFLALEDNPEFLEYTLNSKNVENQLRKIVSSGARMDGLLNISFQEYTSIFIRCPIRKEQDIIAILIKSLDHIITLHQSKSFGHILKVIVSCTLSWEQRKLGEMVERIIRKNEKLESTLPLTISAQYGLIDQNEFFDRRIASKDVRGYYLIKKGEFAYNKSTSVDAPLGAIKRLDKYKNGVLSTLYILFKIIDDTSTSSDYLVTYYATDLWHRGIQSIAAEGARNHGLLNIAPNDFFDTMLSIPLNISEQKKVGDFFISLDHLITLHQRKLEKLKIIKKSMLENLFPQNGEKTPKIRFSGFTEDWEQRKLKYFADYKSSSLTVKDCKEEGKYDLYDANQVIGKTDKFVIDEDYITIIKDGAGVGRTRKLSKNTAFIGTMGALTVNNSDLDFLYATLNRIDWNTKTFGSTIPHIYFKDYGEKVYGEPSIEEQKKIGLYFKNIDTLITLHQSKLEKLQKIKKSMLESMFV